MPYVKRDEQGRIITVSETAGPGVSEELPADDPAVAAFFEKVTGHASHLAASDLDLIRVLEDVVELLIDKGTILFTELPNDAQQKILRRQQLRARVGDLQNLISND
ncbi:MAG: tryptophan synthase subunit beta like protein [Halioglobus sp.]|nr:tryptophan synthase subunit beta like protein [Halioglobus sp.]